MGKVAIGFQGLYVSNQDLMAPEKRKIVHEFTQKIVIFTQNVSFV